MSQQHDEVLRLQDLTIDFRTEERVVPAVRGISLSVRRGEVLALVGESGSGKSVTAMSVLQLLPRTATIRGSIEVAGIDVSGYSPAQMQKIRGRTVGMVFQEPMTALNPSMSVGAQVAETLRNHGVGRQQANERAIALLEEVGLPDARKRAGRYPHEFSGGQRQRVVIAIALACEPDVIIADEPTTALDVTVQAEILDLLRRLVRERNAGLLLITHNMGVVADIADEVAVMHHGEVVEQGTAAQVLTDPADGYTRTLLGAVPRLPVAEVNERDAGPSTSPGAESTAAASNDVLRIEKARVVYGRGARRVAAVNDVDLHVGSGEIVGVVGESGSGKSTLARAGIGLIPISGGHVDVLGESLRSRGRISRQTRARLGVVFQDPASSLDPRMTVGESVAEPFHMHPSLAGRPSRVERRSRVRELLDAVKLPAGTLDRYPHELSGGQRQRVALARALALKPGLLVADEPTSALDVSVQEATLDVLRTVHEEFGFGCLFISHDLAVVHQISDRVAVMRHGEVVEHGPASDVLVNPQQEYTRRLVQAVPSPDPAEQTRRRQRRLAGRV